jgi:hypothetical protein
MIPAVSDPRTADPPALNGEVAGRAAVLRSLFGKGIGIGIVGACQDFPHSSGPDYRAVLDAEVTFLNGGGSQTQGFRLHLPDITVTGDQLA